MGSEVEGNKNPQELEESINGKILNENEAQMIAGVATTFSEINDDNESSSTTKTDEARPHHDDITDSADLQADESAVTDDKERIAQPHSELAKPKMPPEISNSPSSTTKNDDVCDIPSADNHASRLAITDNKDNITKEQERIVQPHSELPKPQIPPALLKSPSSTTGNDDVSRFPIVDMPAIGKFFRVNLSTAIAKRISSFKDENYHELTPTPRRNKVTEFNLSGIRVIVRKKNDNDEHVMKGRISFFSRSNCRDCAAVRKFFRETRLKFVEINIDVFREREKELREKTGTTAVPAIFFNEKFFGGLVALNSLRNSGGLEQRLLKEVMSVKCPDDAPAPPVYGFDDASEEDQTDEMLRYVKVLRQKLPIQDRWIKMKMKIIQNCFTGAQLMELLIRHLNCDSCEAVEIGKQLSKKHFIHHVFGEDDFEDGNKLYRFLEHEPFITGCFNFRGKTNDSETKPAIDVCQRLNKFMSAILESYASDDRQYLDYAAIGKSEEFRRYTNMTQDLQRLNLLELSESERLAFFLNLYNAMVIHALTVAGSPQGLLDRNFFFSDFKYVVGGLPYSLKSIKDGILRCNRRPPYSLMKTFGLGDKQLELALVKMNPLIHFGLFNGTKSSPKVRFFSHVGVGVVEELRRATRDFFIDGGAQVDLEKRTVYLTPIIKWFNMDFGFGQEKDILKWLINYLDATKAGLLTHLLGDGGPVNISYQNFDWSVNY